jgi:hypothetical protein
MEELNFKFGGIKKGRCLILTLYLLLTYLNQQWLHKKKATNSRFLEIRRM